MDIDKLTSIVARLFMVVAYLGFALAVGLKLLTVLGVTAYGGRINPANLLSWSAILAILVIPLLLRQIREQSRKT